MAGLFGNRNAAGPHKKSALRTGASWGTQMVTGGAQFGAGLGAYAAHKGSKALGVNTTKKVLLQGALKGAKYGARTNIATGLAVGAATAVGSHILKKRAEERSLKGRSKAAMSAVKAKATKLKGKLK